MNEEIEELGVIIQDFSAVSEWEIFILRIEETIKEWKLTDSSKERPLEAKDFHDLDWKITKEKINYGGEEFLIVRYKLIIPKTEIDSDFDETDKYSQAFSDISISDNDFDYLGNQYRNDIPPIGIWFGLRDFVVLIPAYDLTDESKIKLVLSSISIAITNTGCEIPIFLQCREDWQRFYLGVCESRGLCMKFDTIHLRNLPSTCHNLGGILDLFKGKISSTISLNTVSISNRFLYTIKHWPSLSWNQKPPEFDYLKGKFNGLTDAYSFPFGAIQEPIKMFTLFVTWLNLSDDTVVDSQSYTDFDPLLAPFWSLNVEMVDEPKCLLYNIFTKFLVLSENETLFSELLSIVQDFDYGINNSMFPSPKPILPAISKLDANSNDFQMKESPLPLCYDLVLPLLRFVFDQDRQSPDQPLLEEKLPFTVGPDNLKADMVNGLVFRLAVASAYARSFGKIDGLGHLWYEFCQELRYRWENALAIPGIMDGFPNSRTCLLHQKLQMINICVDRRRRRDEVAKLKVPDSSSEEEEEDDEFYECDDSDTKSVSSGGKKYLPWNKPSGRLGKFGNLTLITNGEPMFIPITQEPVPKTEDQLEEDAQAMLNLGTDKEASEIRATIMSASLLSDMESFKAANPNAVFEDFIRWYSPKDWIIDEEDGEKKGHLSTRMMIPNNIWIQTWNSAKMVPAKRQRRLFDDTTEAEKTLHFLETRTIGQIVDLLTPPLTQAVLSKLGEECRDKPEIPQLEKAFEHLIATATKLTRDRADVKKYESLADQIYKVELAVAQLKSLRLKFSDKPKQSDKRFVEFFAEMLKGEQAEITGTYADYLRAMVCQMFFDAKQSEFGATLDDPLPKATEKEFVVRVVARRPASTSTPSPQMMRVILRTGECRILGAFTEDIIFG